MNFEQMQEARMAAEADFQRRRQEEERRGRMAVRSWLSAANTDADQERYTEFRKDYPGSGHWLLADGRMRDWFDGSSASVLWINGIPGAGSLPFCHSVMLYMTGP
jgi:hypothetical protein